MKDWWKFVTIDFTPADHAAVTRERFTKLFRDEYVPEVERERLAQEFLSLMQKTKSVTEITGMFHERVLFYPDHVSTN